MALRRAQDGPGWAQDGRDKNPEIGRMSSSRQQNNPRLVVCLLSSPAKTSKHMAVCLLPGRDANPLIGCMSLQPATAASSSNLYYQQPAAIRQKAPLSHIGAWCARLLNLFGRDGLRGGTYTYVTPSSDFSKLVTNQLPATSNGPTCT